MLTSDPGGGVYSHPFSRLRLKTERSALFLGHVTGEEMPGSIRTLNPHIRPHLFKLHFYFSVSVVSLVSWLWRPGPRPTWGLRMVSWFPPSRQVFLGGLTDTTRIRRCLPCTFSPRGEPSSGSWVKKKGGGVNVPPPNIHPQTPAPSDSGPDVTLRPIS